MLCINEAMKLAAELLPDARLWIRRSSASGLDEELLQTIAACLYDLDVVGVDVRFNDPLIQQAVKFYVKSHFGSSDDSEKWDKAYDKVKDSLSLSLRYRSLD